MPTLTGNPLFWYECDILHYTLWLAASLWRNCFEQ